MSQNTPNTRISQWHQNVTNTESHLGCITERQVTFLCMLKLYFYNNYTSTFNWTSTLQSKYVATHTIAIRNEFAFCICYSILVGSIPKCVFLLYIKFNNTIFFYFIVHLMPKRNVTQLSQLGFYSSLTCPSQLRCSVSSWDQLTNSCHRDYK